MALEDALNAAGKKAQDDLQVTYTSRTGETKMIAEARVLLDRLGHETAKALTDRGLPLVLEAAAHYRPWQDKSVAIPRLIAKRKVWLIGRFAIDQEGRIYEPGLPHPIAGARRYSEYFSEKADRVEKEFANRNGCTKAIGLLGPEVQPKVPSPDDADVFHVVDGVLKLGRQDAEWSFSGLILDS